MPKFKGSGGAIFDIDIPAEGTLARERFDEQLAAGMIAPVEDDPAAPAPARGGRRAIKPTDADTSADEG